MSDPVYPLQEVLHALSATPRDAGPMRGVLAYVGARWLASSGRSDEALGLLGESLEAVPDLRPAMRLAFQLYLERNDVRLAVTYLDREIRATRHPREAAAIYRERGELVERYFRDLSAALQCYQAALRATPEDLAVLRSVERIALARGDLKLLTETLEQQAEIVRDPKAASAILHDLALLELRHAGDLALAADLAYAALDLAPDRAAGASDCIRIAELSSDPELLLRALEVDATRRAPEQRAVPLMRMSQVLREHKERNASLALLRAAAYAGRTNLGVWRALEELAMSASRYDLALEATIGAARALGEEDPEQRAEFLYRAGKLALTRLERSGEGLALLRRALKLNPRHPPALEEAARAMIQAESWASLLELSRAQAQHELAYTGSSAAEKAQAQLRVGRLLEDRLKEPEQARRAYEEAMSIAPNYRPARDRYERLLHELGDLVALRVHYRAELAKEPVTALPRRRYLFSVLGQLHSNDADPSEAIGLLVALLSDAPSHVPSLQLLARLLAKAGRKRELLKVTEQECKLTDSPMRKARLLHRIGELAEEQGDAAKARASFEAAVEAVDDYQPALASLEQVLRVADEAEPLLALLRKQLLYANDRERQAALRLEIAALLHNRLDRREEAFAELRSLLERWPRHLPALHAAEALAFELGRWNVLIELLEQHVSSVTGPRTRALLLHRIATLRARRLNDHEGAVKDLVRALELWPQLGVARAFLLRLYERLGRSAELQGYAEGGLSAERGADDRRALALQLAELTPRAVVAVQYLGAVAEARPDDFMTQLRLARAARAAGRPSREAGALAAALPQLCQNLASDHPLALATRFQVARAEEIAGNLDRADASYAAVLDAQPGHALARRGRLRIKARKAAIFSSRELGASEAELAKLGLVDRAALTQVAAEAYERRGDLNAARELIDEALGHVPLYLPALHAKARVSERLGGPENLQLAIATLKTLHDQLRVPQHRVQVLCRIGSISLRLIPKREPNPGAWAAFCAALEIDPDHDLSARGLFKTASGHGYTGAPPLHPVISKRIARLLRRREVDPREIRALARICSDAVGPEEAAALIQPALDRMPNDPGLHADLAQLYARMDRWDLVERELDLALSREPSPERSAALHFFAGDAAERATAPERAITHYLAAASGGYHPAESLLAAERIAQRIGEREHRVKILQQLVALGDGELRVRSLRVLADLYRGPLGEPERAIELMQELLVLRPLDLDVAIEYARVLTKLDRRDERDAVLLASIAHHRSWLRAHGLRVHGLALQSHGTSDSSEADDSPFDATVLLGLRRLFDRLGESDGVFLTTAALETLDPALVPEELRCDRLIADPWPIPRGKDLRAYDVLVGDLPCSAALDLLHAVTFHLSWVPTAPPPPRRCRGVQERTKRIAHAPRR